MRAFGNRTFFYVLIILVGITVVGVVTSFYSDKMRALVFSHTPVSKSLDSISSPLDNKSHAVLFKSLRTTSIPVGSKSFNSTPQSLKPASSPMDSKAPATFQKTLKSTPSSAHKHNIIAEGANLQAGDLEVHINGAFQYARDPQQPLLQTVFLNGWMRHKTNIKFKCCLLTSLDRSETLTEVEAELYHEYSQWLVDMQTAEFVCRADKNNLGFYNKTFKYVALVEKSCSNTSQNVLKIHHPQRKPGSVGMCLKISYGSLDPIKAMEWLEYHRLMNVTMVFTYYHQLDHAALNVFKYYNNTGFLNLLPIDPAIKKGGKPRAFTHPRYNEQAFVDEVLAINDCKHRMAGFDYVIAYDIDEFVVPKLKSKPNGGTLHDVLSEASRVHPKGATFGFSPYIVVLDWEKTRESPLFIASYTRRTNWVNYDGYGLNTKWAFQPLNTYFGQTNTAWPAKGYQRVDVPSYAYTHLHYRKCKPYWKTCKTLPDNKRETDPSIEKYEAELIHRILALPIGDILPYNLDYVKGLQKWNKSHS